MENSCTRMYACVFVYLYTHVHAYKCIYSHMYTVNMCVCIFIHTYNVYMHVYANSLNVLPCLVYDTSIVLYMIHVEVRKLELTKKSTIG